MNLHARAYRGKTGVGRMRPRREGRAAGAGEGRRPGGHPLPLQGRLAFGAGPRARDLPRLLAGRPAHPRAAAGKTSRPAKRRRDRGIALILVLWVVALLSVAALSFSLLVRSEAQATLAYKEGMENKFLAEAGMRRAVLELFYRKAGGRHEVWEEGREIFQCDGRPYAGEVAGGHYRVSLADESGKINLNGLTDRTGIVLKNLLRNDGVAEASADIIVDAILDWKDKDNLPRLHGAEDEYYQSLPRPYRAKNGDFETLEELFLVRGLSPDILTGAEKRKGLLSSCTIYATSGKINVNAASPDVLRAIPGMTEDIQKRILAYRDRDPLEQGQSFAAWLGADWNVLAPYATVAESNVYAVDALGYQQDDKRGYRLRAVVAIEGPQQYRILRWQSPAAGGP